jgi:hypothetical protein
MIKTLSSASLRSSRTASAWGSRKQGTTRPGHGSDPARITPAFSWVSPNLCDDGHDAPCVTGAPGGLAQAGCFLSQRVPKIMAAPAYQDCGLIVNGVHYPVRYRGGMDGRHGGRNADAALAAAPVSARGRVSRLTPPFRQDAAATFTQWATGS